MGVVPSRRVNVQVGLPPEIVRKIQLQDDYQEPAPGRAGGVAAWVRALVIRELGIEYQDPHEAQAEEFARPKK